SVSLGASEFLKTGGSLDEICDPHQRTDPRLLSEQLEICVSLRFRPRPASRIQKHEFNGIRCDFAAHEWSESSAWLSSLCSQRGTKRDRSAIRWPGSSPCRAGRKLAPDR